MTVVGVLGTGNPDTSGDQTDAGATAESRTPSWLDRSGERVDQFSTALNEHSVGSRKLVMLCSGGLLY